MLEDIRSRHKQDEVEFNKVSKGLVHQDRGELLSLIDKYKSEIVKLYHVAADYNIINSPNFDRAIGRVDAVKEIAELLGIDLEKEWIT